MIHTGYRPLIVFAGDSITSFDWMASIRTQITAGISALAQSGPSYTQGDIVAHGLRFDPRIGAGATYVNSGVGGWTAEQMDAAWATKIGAFAPTHLVLFIGINNVILKTNPAVDAASFSTAYDSIVTKTQNAFPNCQVICCTLLVLGENWPSGANAQDNTTCGVEDLCSRIRTIATNRNCELVDFRETVYAVQEPIYNPGHAIANILYDNTGPGGTALHPNATGQGLMCTQFMSQVVMP